MRYLLIPMIVYLIGLCLFYVLQGSSGEHVSMKFAMVMTGSRIIIEVVDCECIVRQDSTGHLRLHVIGDDGDKIACSSIS